MTAPGSPTRRDVLRHAAWAAGAAAAASPLAQLWAQDAAPPGGQVGSPPPAAAPQDAAPPATPGQPPAPTRPNVPAGMDLLGAGSLKAHAAARGLRFGFAVNSRLLRESESYRQAVISQCNIVVGENCMKWGALRPSPTTFNFTDADELVAFAAEHSMAVRGHNLCWHENLPPWFAATVTRDNAAQFLTEHIRTVVGRYRGRVHSWDVVNEAVHPRDGRPDGLRLSPWLDLLGPGYIDLAFRTAREADPAAVLTYNDFGVEYDVPDEIETRTAILRLLRRMQAARTPVDAVGIQSHLRTSDVIRLGEGVRNFANQLRKMRLTVAITELDVNADTLPDLETLQFDRDVAAVYRRYLDAMLESPATRSILVWGVADQQSWLQAEKWRPKHPGRAQRPLPFLLDETGQYRAKPAFFAIRDSIDAAKPR